MKSFAEELRPSDDAMWVRISSAGQLSTYMVVGRDSLALCFALASHCRGTFATRLLVVKLQVFQTLR